MQPGAKSIQLERARNVADLGPVGDPERWGGIGKFHLRLTSDPQEVWTPQIVRVQCADLAARSWDLICGWQVENLGPNDAILRQGLELTFGVGQATWVAVLDLRASVLGIIPLVGPPTILQPAVAWEFQPGNQGIAAGTVSLPVSLPAAAIAARAVFAASTPDKEHVIKGRVFVAVSPRGVV